MAAINKSDPFYCKVLFARHSPLNAGGGHRALGILKASDWWGEEALKEIRLVVLPGDTVVGRWVVWNDGMIEARTTVATFREMRDARKFYKVTTTDEQPRRRGFWRARKKCP